MADTYVIALNAGQGVVNVTNYSAMFVDETAHFCGSYFEKVPSTIEGQALSSEDKQGLSSFFYLKDVRHGLYLSAIWASVDDSADASTLFTLAAAGTSQSEAIPFATKTYEGVGFYPDSLVFILDEEDWALKSFCGGSSSPVRVYQTPTECGSGSPPSNPRGCPLSWQICNVNTGYCQDSTVLDPPKNPKSSIPPTPVTPPSPPLPFPNCVDQSVLHLVPMSSSGCKQMPVTPSAQAEKAKTVSSLYNTVADIGVFVIAVLAVTVLVMAWSQGASERRRVVAKTLRLAELQIASGEKVTI